MKQKIYDMRAKYANGYVCDEWCETKEDRDAWLEIRRGCPDAHGGLVEIQQYTYVLKGEKIEYCVPEIHREKE